MSIEQPNEPHHVLLTAALITISGQLPILLREISARAAFICGHSLPDAGTRIAIARNRVNLLGHIVWSNGSAAEVRIEDPVSDHDLMEGLKFIQRPLKVEPPYHRPGFHHFPLSPQEKELLEKMRLQGGLAPHFPPT